jgi:hypothetical protein
MNEIFYPIPNYEKLYSMNRLGQIKSIKNDRYIHFIKPIVYTNSRLIYTLYKNSKPERHSIYQWFSITFGTIEYKRMNLNRKLI